jgi:hypothetical protein
MREIVFLVEDDPEGGYTARALSESIFTQADDIETLRDMVRDAVHCHFPDEQNRSKVIRLHIVRDEVIASGNSHETYQVKIW